MNKQTRAKMHKSLEVGRPWPRRGLTTVEGLASPDLMEPAPHVAEWITAVFLEESAPLFNPDHSHLRGARLGCLWTNVCNMRNVHQIAGTCELVRTTATGKGAWPRARGLIQLREWFDDPMPDFLITLDALVASELDDVSWCALIEHQLYHAGQATDRFGTLQFDKVTGKPRYAIRPHDVSEFSAVVARYGVAAAGESAVSFAIAAGSKPTIGTALAAEACGVCLRLAA